MRRPQTGARSLGSRLEPVQRRARWRRERDGIPSTNKNLEEIRTAAKVILDPLRVDALA